MVPSPKRPLTGKGVLPRSRPRPGDRIAARYRLLRPLGQGAYGEVFEADDEALGIPVAVKLLRLSGKDPSERVRRLKREVLLARTVAHPNVATVYDIGCHEAGDGPQWFLTMELLRGETLRARLQREGRLRVSDAAPIVRQIIDGLGAAHHVGVVHLDLKPDNILLVGEREPVAKIVDFGLANAVWPDARPATAGGAAILGTPPYMAPEQVLGFEAGPAADFFALGVMLFEMLTGEYPYPGSTPLDMAQARLTHPPRSLLAAQPDASRRWARVIAHCLEREPRQRFASAEELGQTLFGPPTDPSTTVHRTLPRERDAFIGRSAEKHELMRLFDAGGRLVTLAGPGGIGKTRLAVRFAIETTNEWPGGVWFCDLTDARDATDVAHALARSLGLSPSGRPEAQVATALAERHRALVVLDNAENVAALGMQPVAHWMDAALEVCFLVTTRERTRLPGERVLALDALSPPEALDLLLERVERQQPSLRNDPELREAGADIVRWVEGIPLAIELVADRLRVLAPRQLAQRLETRLPMLRGGVGRHATLEAVLDDSYSRLGPWERSAWRQCAVFEGGFSLEAAEAVIDLRAWPDAPWTIDVLQVLIDKSLIRMWVPEEADGARAPEARFGFYETLREYARKHWADPDDPIDRATLWERHARWFARYGEPDALMQLERGDQRQRRAVERERANLLVACRRAVAGEVASDPGTLFLAAWSVLQLQGPLQLAVDLGERTLAAELGEAMRGRVLSALADAAQGTGRPSQARAHLTTALDIADRLGDAMLAAQARTQLGTVEMKQGERDGARAHLERAVTEWAGLGDARGEGVARFTLGILERETGHIAEALHQEESALALVRRAGDRRFEGIALVGLGNLLLLGGRLHDARLRYAEALDVFREVADRRSEGITFGNLADLQRELGDFDAAFAAYDRALAIARDVGNLRSEGLACGGRGWTLMQVGQVDEALLELRNAIRLHAAVANRDGEAVDRARLARCQLLMGATDAAHDLEEAIRAHEALGSRRELGIELAWWAEQREGEESYEQAAAAWDRAEGLLRDYGERLELAKVRARRAAFAARRGELEAARAALREAREIADVLHVTERSELANSVREAEQAIATSQ